MTRRLPRVLVALLAALALCAGASAQTGRAALVAGHEAYDFFDVDAALRNYALGLNPAAGARDSLWVLGVYRLAEFLVTEQGDEALADAWLRWAFRQFPGMPLDTILFVPDLVNRFRAARALADTTRPQDATLRLSWTWPRAAPTLATPGTVFVQPQDYGITVQLDDESLFLAGGDRALTAGTHRLRLYAPGYGAATVFVEILPGVTTVVDLDMAPLFGGALYVDAEPWGVVYVDGDSVGYTMLGAHPLLPGEHRVSIRRQGYLPFDTTLVVAQNDSLRLGTIRLRPVGGGRDR